MSFLCRSMYQDIKQLTSQVLDILPQPVDRGGEGGELGAEVPSRDAQRHALMPEVNVDSCVQVQILDRTYINKFII